jgi:hypothetical protein
MNFRKLLGLAALGGLIYAHKKHGGELTLASFKQSARDLLEGAKSRTEGLKAQAGTRLHEAANKVASAADVSPKGTPNPSA